MIIQQFSIFDADESIFFLRELEKVKAKSYDVKYAALKARTLIPISREAGPGDESITYEQYDQVGMFQIVSNYADDLPASDVKGKEFTAKIKSLGGSYKYSLQEARAAVRAGKPLQQRKANSARRAHLQKENRLAFFGDSSAGFLGFLNHPNVPIVTNPNDGAGSSTTFTSKTADQVIRDLNSLTHSVVSVSNDVEHPDTLLLPVTRGTYLNATPRSSTSDTSILKYYLGNNGYVKGVEMLNELETAGVGPSKRAMVYRRDIDAVSMEVPQDFEQLPVQERNLAFVVPCHARYGGVLFYYPLSAAYMDGI